jgi:hypothetical protein
MSMKNRDGKQTKPQINAKQDRFLLILLNEVDEFCSKPTHECTDSKLGVY